MDILKPKDVIKILNVLIKTFQRWNNDGTLLAYRNSKNRRYYTKEQKNKFLGKEINKNKKNVAYARIFNIWQKDDIDN